MGSCMSIARHNSVSNDHEIQTAKVITIDGSLNEYPPETKVHTALGRDHPSCFICSSDELCYDRGVPPLATQASLQVGQLYFVLPASQIECVLSGEDMAALAVKASVALAALARQRAGRRAGKVVPMFGELIGFDGEEDEGFGSVKGVKRFEGGVGAKSDILENKRMLVRGVRVMRRKIGGRLSGNGLGTIQEDVE